MFRILRLVSAMVLLFTTVVVSAQEGTVSPSHDPKTLVQRYLDAYNAGDTATLETLIAETFVNHVEGTPPGREGYLALINSFRDAFPDMQITNQLMIAEGDYVMSYHIATGTNTGSMMGNPPTGNAVSVAIFDVFRVQNGLLTEHWDVTDTLSLFQQLGLAPAQDAFRSGMLLADPDATLPSLEASPEILSANRAAIQRYAELFTDLDAVITEVFAPLYINHLNTGEAIIKSRDEFRQEMAGILPAFPDMANDPSTVITLVDGDLVGIYSVARGTNTGSLFGAPATNLPVTLANIDIYRVRDGAFVEHWGLADLFSLMQQLNPTASGS